MPSTLMLCLLFFPKKKNKHQNKQYCTWTSNPAHAGVNDYFFQSLFLFSTHIFLYFLPLTHQGIFLSVLEQEVKQV